MRHTIYGADMGTNNIKIYNGRTREIFNARNVIALKNKKEIFAVGDSAYQMYEKTPDNVQVIFPVQNGVIADLKNMENLFDRLFILCNDPRIVRSGRFLIAVPTDITEVEKRAFYDVIAESSIKVREIKVVEKPVADAVGAGIDIESPKGNMIVNIGADTTEITVTSSGGIVISRMIQTGGNRLDDVICNIVKRKYNIIIGHKTAERLKFRLADAMYDEKLEDAQIYSVFGRNLITGLPSERPVASDLICDAVEDFLKSIIESIVLLLERTPPELSSDIRRTGIYLTGGSAQIKNIAARIEKGAGLKVNRVRTPGESVIRGIAKIISDSRYKRLVYTPREETAVSAGNL